MFAATEAFSQRNINCSVSDSLKRFEPIMAACPQPRCGAWLCRACWAAPTKARSAPSRWHRLPASCATWAATRYRGRHYRHRHRRRHPAPVRGGRRRCHASNWPGTSMTRMARPPHASLLEGINVFDSSVAGLGGCPYARAPPAISPARMCTVAGAGHRNRHRPGPADCRWAAHQPGTGRSNGSRVAGAHGAVIARRHMGVGECYRQPHFAGKTG